MFLLILYLFIIIFVGITFPNNNYIYKRNKPMTSRPKVRPRPMPK